jgi:hypothetical protein
VRELDDELQAALALELLNRLRQGLGPEVGVDLGEDFEDFPQRLRVLIRPAGPVVQDGAPELMNHLSGGTRGKGGEVSTRVDEAQELLERAAPTFRIGHGRDPVQDLHGKRIGRPIGRRVGSGIGAVGHEVWKEGVREARQESEKKSLRSTSCFCIRR